MKTTMSMTGVRRGMPVVLLAAGLAAGGVAASAASARHGAVMAASGTRADDWAETSVAPGTLPPGKEYDILSASCQTCHSLGMILQQRSTAKVWAAQITLMQSFGAPVTNAQKAELVPYLARYLGPQVPRASAAHEVTERGGALVTTSTSSSARSSLLSVNTGTRSATLTLIAASTGALGGFNFNGDGNGKMLVSVPAGYTVDVVYSNHSQVPHSVVFTPYAQRNRVSTFALAFSGSASPHPTAGISSAGGVQRFHFVARTAGRYAIVCAVPGHEEAGMWDTLVVTKGGTARMTL